jgi:hypothetical protein
MDKPLRYLAQSTAEATSLAEDKSRLASASSHREIAIGRWTIAAKAVYPVHQRIRHICEHAFDREDARRAAGRHSTFSPRYANRSGYENSQSTERKTTSTRSYDKALQDSFEG